MYRRFLNQETREYEYFLRSGLKEDRFGFLFYIYNRGGVFSFHTLIDYFLFSRRSAFYCIENLKRDKYIIDLFPKSNFTSFKMKTSAQLFRVSNKFLRLVDDGNSSIKKLRDIKRGLRFLITAQFFMQEKYRTWTLINRKKRKSFLLETFSLSEKVLPQYWVGGINREGIKSVNHEIALDPNKVPHVVFFPSHVFSIATEFDLHLITKWNRLFQAIPKEGNLKILAISDTELSKRYFDKHRANDRTHFQNKGGQEGQEKKLVGLERILAMSRGEITGKEQTGGDQQGNFLAFTHIHYPRFATTYGLSKEAPL